MSGKGSPYRNIVLISQIGINMLVPVFIRLLGTLSMDGCLWVPILIRYL